MGMSQLENRGLAATYDLSNEPFTSDIKQLLESKIGTLQKSNNTSSSTVPLTPEFLSEVKEQNLKVTHSAQKLKFTTIAQWILVSITTYAVAHAIISPMLMIGIAVVCGALTIVALVLSSKYKKDQENEVDKLAKLILPNLSKLGEAQNNRTNKNESHFKTIDRIKKSQQQDQLDSPEKSKPKKTHPNRHPDTKKPKHLPPARREMTFDDAKLPRSNSWPIMPSPIQYGIKKSASLPELKRPDSQEPLTLVFKSNEILRRDLSEESPPLISVNPIESSTSESSISDASPMDEPNFFHKVLYLVIKDHDCEPSQEQTQGLLNLLLTKVENPDEISQYHQLAHAINEITHDRRKTVNILANVMFLRYLDEDQLNEELPDEALSAVVKNGLNSQLSHLSTTLSASSHDLATQIMQQMDTQFPNNKIEDAESLYCEYLIHAEFKTVFESLLESETLPEKEVVAQELKKKVAELLPGLNVSALDEVINASAEALLNEIKYPPAISSKTDLQKDSTTQESLALSNVTGGDGEGVGFDE